MRTRPALTALPILLAVLSACGRFPPSPTPTLFLLPTAPPPTSPLPASTATPANAAPAALPPPGPCSHLLWPLVDGAAWTYNQIDPSGSRQVVLSAHAAPDGMILDLDGITSRLNCLDGALAGQLPGILGAGHPALGASLIGSAPRGSLLPDSALLLPLGAPAVWDQEMEAGGLITLPGLSPDPLTVEGGRQVLFHTTAAPTTITVPAGAFTALPVRQDVLYEIRVRLPDGAPADVLINTALEIDLVEGIGPVAFRFMGGQVSTPSGAWPLDPGASWDLVSYRIP